MRGIPKRAGFLLPLLGALGFFAGSEMSLRDSDRFVLWSAATMCWTLLAFAVLAWGRLAGRLTRVAVPAIVMIAVSTVASLLFLDLVAPRHAFIVVFAVVVYLFLEHVRREVEHPDPDEVLSITEFARMVNIGSLFLLAVVGIGLTFFLTLEIWKTALPFALLSVVWSWHLFGACYKACGEPMPYVVLTAAVATETYLATLLLPTSIFVGGAVVAVIYYLAANLLRASIEKRVTERLLRRYVMMGAGFILLLLLTARWI